MPLDDADKKFIADLLKKNNEDQAVEIGKTIDAKLKPVADKVDGVEKTAKDAAEKVEKAAKEPDKGGKEPDNKGGKGGAGAGDDPAVADLKRRLDEAEKREQEQARLRKEEADKRLTEQRRGAIRDALVEAGMPADRTKHAITFLEAEGLITTDEKTGAHGFKSKDKYGVEQIVGGKAGAAGWLATDDGKTYLPPKGVTGTGDGAGNRQGAGNTGTAPRNDKGALDWGALGGRALTGAANAMDAAD